MLIFYTQIKFQLRVHFNLTQIRGGIKISSIHILDGLQKKTKINLRYAISVEEILVSGVTLFVNNNSTNSYFLIAIFLTKLSNPLWAIKNNCR